MLLGALAQFSAAALFLATGQLASTDIAADLENAVKDIAQIKATLGPISELLKESSRVNIRFVHLVILIAAGGALGGVIEFLRNFEFKSTGSDVNGPGHKYGAMTLNDCEFRICDFFAMACMAALIGAGGGFAGALLFSLIKQFPVTQTAENLIFVVALSVVSGFAARKILPAVADEILRKKVEQVQSDVEKAQKESKESVKKVELDLLINKVITTLNHQNTGDGNPEQIDDCIKEIGNSLLSYPYNRQLNILLGRCYRVKGDYPRAIMVLEQFVSLKTSDKSNIPQLSKRNDVDVAAALYNISCYKCLQALETSDNAKKKELLEEAVSALERAEKLDQSVIEAARHDKDFKALLEDGYFDRRRQQPA